MCLLLVDDPSGVRKFSEQSILLSTFTTTAAPCSSETAVAGLVRVCASSPVTAAAFALPAAHDVSFASNEAENNRLHREDDDEEYHWAHCKADAGYQKNWAGNHLQGIDGYHMRVGGRSHVVICEVTSSSPALHL
mmetsp:Transcript_41230/g.66829  ORF Transcript_41230/g.66829 Transcript_41230/m.66829 type:complete len:135 (-) Transcript_41230:79-483(-)|eukprot:CAMPEP_0174386100 /NCGR_PEP_ID=MMETSP0811_2-20130205/127049_1 /TAXON_ID=73025 ORGANISM="Eutreptiella gymnastica-like, Strain CCMP1594" /NCGR_SAMPLE_ID=MMETSP0811_2 /ASSEMBLY_ACC=CAM_ASM_000667 /LENGTH=134 /DNA_ID=CAMNT_0015540655 /DNA_START=670 /DNA_END=1074 /DNA_ORIENTATION=-